MDGGLNSCFTTVSIRRRATIIVVVATIVAAAYVFGVA
jgi:preprotein translocase subunit SecE